MLYNAYVQARSQKIQLGGAFEEKVDLLTLLVLKQLKIYNCMVYAYSPHS